MKLKNLLNKKNIITISIFSLLTISTNAQWAIFNINDWVLEYMRATRQAVESAKLSFLSQGQMLQMNQADENVVNSDYRNRMAIGFSQIMKADDDLRPTLQQCIDSSKNIYANAAISKSIGGAGSGRGKTSGAGRNAKAAVSDMPTPDPSNPTQAENDQRTPADSKLITLANISKLKMCSTRYGTNFGCTGIDDDFSLGDIRMYSLLQNTKKSDRVNANNVIVNYTFDDAAYKVAQQYILNTTETEAPRMISPEELTKNPTYIATYNSIRRKLDVAHEVLSEIAAQRVGTTLTGNMASTWANNKSEYATIFGSQLKFPTAPSLYEILNFNVHSDLFGKAYQNAKADVKETNQKLAMTNYLLFKMYSQQEQTNILLSQMLVHSVTPTSSATTGTSIGQ
jgi:hypothetical protein